MYVITAAPETQIFQPHLQDELLDSPDLIFKKRPVKIYVERSCGRIQFTLGQPKPFGRHQTSDKEEDLTALIPWLTGGDDGMQNSETEIYGTVSMDLDENIAGLVDEIVHTAAISGEVPKIPEDLKMKMDLAREKSESMSRDRVMRAIRRCYRQLQHQYKINQESGLGKYQPSKTEILCQFVLRREIAAEKARQEKIEASMNETLMGEGLDVDTALTETTPAPVKRIRRKKTHLEEQMNELQPESIRTE